MDPIQLLSQRFIKARQRNPRYSLRSFSRDLGFAPAVVSELLAGKRPLTSKTALRLASALCLSETERRNFLAYAQMRSRRHIAQHGGFNATSRTHHLAEDEFALIAEWYHYAILSLLRTTRTIRSAECVAKHLGIPLFEARMALRRLDRLSFIEFDGTRWRRTVAPIRTTTEVPSIALRASHRQTLEQAIQALNSMPVEARSITAATMPFDVSRMSEAKAMITQFQRDFAQIFDGTGSDPSNVVNLSIQLVPVTTNETSSTTLASDSIQKKQQAKKRKRKSDR